MTEQQHRVRLGMRADRGWYAECLRCPWTYENTSPSITRDAADRHGEVTPGGYLPRAYVKALVLDMMSPPDEPATPTRAEGEGANPSATPMENDASIRYTDT